MRAAWRLHGHPYVNSGAQPEAAGDRFAHPVHAVTTVPVAVQIDPSTKYVPGVVTRTTSLPRRGRLPSGIPRTCNTSRLASAIAGDFVFKIRTLCFRCHDACVLSAETGSRAVPRRRHESQSLPLCTSGSAGVKWYVVAGIRILGVRQAVCPQSWKSFSAKR